jgi:hypothetical protein
VFVLVVTRWQRFVGNLANKQASASFFVSRLSSAGGDATMNPDELSPSESGTLTARLWKQAFALSELPRGLYSPANPLAFLPHSFLRRLFIGLPPLHFAKKAFALQLLFQHPKGLFNIVFPNENFQRCLLFRVISLCLLLASLPSLRAGNCCHCFRFIRGLLSQALLPQMRHI